MNYSLVLKRWVGAGLILLSLNFWLVACGNPTSAPTPSAQATLPAGVGPSDWPMWGRDARRSAYNPGATQMTPATAANLALHWVYEAAGPIETSPAVVGDILYFNDGRGQLLALNRTDGAIRWRYEYGGTSHSSPAFAAGKVFLAADSGQVLAVGANDGKMVWQRKLNRPVQASPLLEGATLYLATLADAAGNPGTLVVLDVETGAVQWEYGLPTGFVQNTPPVAGGAFYLPEAASPASGGVVRIGKDSRPATFEVSQANRPAIYGAGQLYTATGRGLAALPAEQRLASPTWFYNANLEATKTDAPALPAVTTETALVPLLGADGNSVLKGVNLKDGLQRWEVKSPGLLGPVAIGGTVAFVGSSDGRLVAVETDKGRELWNYQIGAAIRAMPTVAGEAVYVGGQDGRLYAFGPPTNAAPANPTGLQIYSTPDTNGIPQIFTLDANGKSTPLLTGDFTRPTGQDPNWPLVPGSLRATAALSPDGRKIAFVSYSAASVRFKTNLFLINVDGSNPQPLGDANALPQDLAWAPDGKELFFTGFRTNSLYSVKLDGPNQAELLNKTPVPGTLSLPVASPDGRFIYFAAFDGSRDRAKAALGRVDRAGSNLLVIAREETLLTSLAVSPDGRWLAYVLSFENNKPSEIWLRSATGEQPRKLGDGVGPLAFAPDGRWLAYGDNTGRKLLPLDINANLLPDNSNAYPLALPSERIFSLGWAKTGGAATTPEPGQLQAGLVDPTRIYNDPAGKFVFSSNGRLYLMNSTATALALVPGQPSGRNYAPQFSGDGKRLAFVNEANGPDSAQIWVWQVGKDQPRQLTFRGRNWWPALSEDGSAVAFSSIRNGLSAPEIFLLRPNFDTLADPQLTQRDEAGVRQLTSIKSGAYQPSWYTDNILIFAGYSTKNIAGNPVEPILNLWRLSVNNQAETYPLSFLDSTSASDFLGLVYPLAVPGQQGFYATQLLKTGEPQAMLGPAFFSLQSAKFERRRTECPGYSPVWLNQGGSQMACISDARLQKTGPGTLQDLMEGRTPVGGIWRGASLKAAGEAVNLPFSLLSSDRYPVDGLAWGK